MLYLLHLSQLDYNVLTITITVEYLISTAEVETQTNSGNYSSEKPLLQLVQLLCL